MFEKIREEKTMKPNQIQVKRIQTGTKTIFTIKNGMVYGMNPKSFDCEEINEYEVESIVNYIDNCKLENGYEIVKSKLMEIARNEIKIEVIDCEG